MALLAEFFGGKPETPKFKPIDVQAEQSKAIAGNAASLPALEAQGAQINSFNQEQLLAQLRKAIPGFDEIMARGSAAITSQLKGEIPQDVADAIKRNTAVKALYGGYGGSGMANNLTARDLGLTSLNLVTQGLNSANQWIQGARAASVPNLFDVTTGFISPQFQTQFAAEERDKQFQRDYIKNQWDWYDSFGQQAARFEDTTVQLAAAIGGSLMTSGAA